MAPLAKKVPDPCIRPKLPTFLRVPLGTVTMTMNCYQKSVKRVTSEVVTVSALAM